MPIAFDEVSFSYEGERGPRALDSVSFDIRDGEFFGIAGHTGSGKSTLIQHMNGLLSPTRGRVIVDGGDLADKHHAAACRGRIGVVFQYPEHQLFAATVREDVAFGPRNLGLAAEEVAQRVDRAIATVGLDAETVGDMSPFELSGGQQRRVALAGVIAMAPTTLVLDEPAAGLDPQGRAGLLALIGELHANGLTIVMVSHSMDDLARMADRILVLNAGRVETLDAPAAVFSRADELRAIGLDVPAAASFAAQLRGDGFDLPQALYDVESLADDIAAQLGYGERANEGRRG